MNITLINPSFNLKKALGGLSTVYTAMPPINLAYLAAVLKKEGYNIKIIDSLVANSNNKINEILTSLKNTKTNLVGISCLTQTANFTYKLAKEIKQKLNIPVVLGNLHASFFAEDILKKNIADIIVHNEGEITFLNLVNALQKNSPLEKVKGISYKLNGEIKKTPAQPLIKDLDTIPFPQWDLFPLQKYRLFSFAEIKNPGTIILGSRGCPYNCSFCSLLIMGNKRRCRSIKNIVAEFNYLHNEFGYKQISFIDPIFPLTKKEGLNFCEELIKENLHKKVIWTTETRVDLVDSELLSAMKNAGLRRIMYGFEMGSEEVLNSINKKTKLNDAVRAVNLTKSQGIEIIGFFMLGAPEENIKSINKTINFAKSLNIDFAKFNILVPYPGTALFDELVREKKIKYKSFDDFTSFPTKNNLGVYSPAKVSKKQLIKLQQKAILKFYLRLKIIYNHLFKIKSVKLIELLKGGLWLLKNYWSK